MLRDLCDLKEPPRGVWERAARRHAHYITVAEYDGLVRYSTEPPFVLLASQVNLMSVVLQEDAPQ